MYSWSTPEPPCQVLGSQRTACHFQNNFFGCVNATPKTVTQGDIQRYRGPVRVEKLVPGFLQDSLVQPHTYAKLWDTLDIVY
jgi:hypothetical protein